MLFGRYYYYKPDSSPMSRTLPTADFDHEDGGELVENATSLAPVEQSSPLGYNVGFIDATLVNTSAMVGRTFRIGAVNPP
jgi:hypothetical protein